MNTTAVRYAYPEIVIGGVRSDWTVIGKAPICNEGLLVSVLFPSSPELSAAFGLGALAEIPIRVHPQAREAFMALAAVCRRFDYRITDGNSGGHNCRKTKGLPAGIPAKTSIHAHGVAADLNPDDNRQGSHTNNYPPGFVDAVLGILTKSGARVFRWGDIFEIPDPMHWEPTACTRTELATGIDWTTVMPDNPEDAMTPEAAAFFQECYEDMIGLKNPHTGLPDPAKPTTLGNLVEEYRERSYITKVPGSKPLELAAKTLE